ncbi:MAG: M81 family metallopeptidase [Clostridia bacterium]|nr:M81 family metallopeptidase [Clostridia bacterium]
MKIILSGFHQEVNTFAPGVNGQEQYARAGSCWGSDMLHLAETFGKQNTGKDALSAHYKALKEAGAEIVAGGFMQAQAGAIIDQSVLSGYIEKLVAIVKENKDIDGVFLALHGAAQTTERDDPEGDIIEAVREAAGAGVVIAVSTDLHANVTDRMIKNADVICGYNTYPHVDIYETGTRAATLGLRMIADRRALHVSHVTIPMIVPASAYTTSTEPFVSLMRRGHELVESGELEDFSIYQMQPWLDVSVGGSSVVTVSKDIEKADKYAKELAAGLYAMRHEFESKLYEIDEIIRIAENNKSGKPVICNDFADSSNAGAAGDSVEVLERIIALESDIYGLIYMNDGPFVDKCFEVGVGKTICAPLGAFKSKKLYTPIQVEAKIKALYDGIMTISNGVKVNMGTSAVIQIRNTIVVVTHEHTMNGDPRLYRCFGYDPCDFDMVVVKACTSFRAFYGPLTDLIYPAATHGAASADLKALKFEKLSRDFYPFTDNDSYVPEIDARGYSDK